MKTKTKPKNNFGRNLRGLRESRGWTQPQLAVKTGVSQAMIHYLETGQKKPGWDTLLALAKALGVGIERLAG